MKIIHYGLCPVEAIVPNSLPIQKCCLTLLRLQNNISYCPMPNESETKHLLTSQDANYENLVLKNIGQQGFMKKIKMKMGS
jgi:hypothetical protein